ncbi:hypothetical protein RN001_008061 [Aquatica leii]|uniref:Pyridoxal phosphate phosphatase PHOSPHO2 n=1 Tax=Aquatica leii TaxID=1421715 RepID=A0AAN7SR77_9COLE|nr:hypothetical protein RN001_008061 [Aquatica leii]
MKLKLPLLSFFTSKSRLKCTTLSQECAKINMNMPKRLAVFDFDSTICLYNSDNVIRNLLPKEVIEDYEQEQQFSLTGWTKYMQGVFELLFNRQIDEAKMTKAIFEIPPIDGMPTLIRELVNMNFDNIIISDANSYFINKWLEQQQLVDCIKQIFTNPAQFEDGCLKIEMYHVQRTCSLSTINLCKGQILDEFLEKQRLEGVNYERIVYVGDGTNDFCPILRLNSGDLACCRSGFSCASIVKDVLNKKPYKNKLYEINADVMMWDNGHDILNVVKESIK